MITNGNFKLTKEIRTGKNSSIPAGTEINLINRIFYINGYPLDKEFQEDFFHLLSNEEERGWNYLAQI